MIRYANKKVYETPRLFTLTAEQREDMLAKLYHSFNYSGQPMRKKKRWWLGER